MIKPLGLGYQKIDMFPNFCMLYYLENVEVTECTICGHSRYKPRTGRRKILVAYKKLPWHHAHRKKHVWEHFQHGHRCEGEDKGQYQD